ncbi:hypothetical protein VR45_39160, partial [Streptomyces sp. NRRL S-495]
MVGSGRIGRRLARGLLGTGPAALLDAAAQVGQAAADLLGRAGHLRTRQRGRLGGTGDQVGLRGAPGETRHGDPAGRGLADLLGPAPALVVGGRAPRCLAGLLLARGLLLGLLRGRLLLGPRLRGLLLRCLPLGLRLLGLRGPLLLRGLGLLLRLGLPLLRCLLLRALRSLRPALGSLPLTVLRREARGRGAGTARLVRLLARATLLAVPALLGRRPALGRAGRQRHRLLPHGRLLGLRLLNLLLRLLDVPLRTARVRHARQHRLHQAEAQRVARVDVTGLEPRPGHLLGALHRGGVGRRQRLGLRSLRQRLLLARLRTVALGGLLRTAALTLLRALGTLRRPALRTGTALAGALALRQPVLRTLARAGTLRCRRAGAARLVGPAVLRLLAAAGGGGTGALRTLLAGAACPRTALLRVLLGTALLRTLRTLGAAGLPVAPGQTGGGALRRPLSARRALREAALLVRGTLLRRGLPARSRSALAALLVRRLLAGGLLVRRTRTTGLRRVLPQRLAGLAGRQTADGGARGTLAAGRAGAALAELRPALRGTARRGLAERGPVAGAAALAGRHLALLARRRGDPALLLGLLAAAGATGAATVGGVG